MTTAGIAEQVADELCRSADVPQASWVVDYAIKNITVRFFKEDKPVLDEPREDLKDDNE